MKKTLLAAFFLVFLSHSAAFSQEKVDQLFFEARGSFSAALAPDESAFRFNGEHFMFHMLGHLSDNITYRVRHRFTKAVFDKENPLNGTDHLWVNWAPTSKWDFTFGKHPILAGGFEWDSAPLDVYYWSGFGQKMWQFYMLGVIAAYNPGPGQRVRLQLCNSPLARGKYNSFNWNLGWYGRMAPWWQTIWTFSLMEDVNRTNLNMISLGNKFCFGEHYLELDWTNRAPMSRFSVLKDWSIVAKLNISAGDWNLFVKGGYDVNTELGAFNAGEPFDVIVMPGTEYAYFGGGVEYYPLKNKIVRLHGLWYTDNRDKSQNLTVGASIRLDVIKKAR